MSEHTPQSAAEILARVKPRRREGSTQICLRPDLLEAHAEANEKLAEMQVAGAMGDGATSGGSRLAGGGATKEAKAQAKKVQALEDEIDETAVTFWMRAMNKDEWRALCDDHPPRKQDQIDGMVGYNRDAVMDELVRLCIFDPVFDDDSWAAFIEVCNPSEWQELRDLANSVNRSVVDAPKSELASRILKRPANASKPRAASE